MDKPLTTPSEKHGDDAMLAKLLGQDGSGFDVAGVKALVAGVLAAAPNAIAADWVRLVAPHPSPELIAALSALAASLSAAPPAPGPGPAERLALLRAELARRGVHGFLVPRADEHQGEYVPRCAQRLAWLTGFTGSATRAARPPKAAPARIRRRANPQARGRS